MISITEKDRRAEEREFKKIQKIIARRDTKALDKWFKKYLRIERKEERRYNKQTKKDF